VSSSIPSGIVGLAVDVIIVKDGVAQDISSATIKQFHITHPSGLDRVLDVPFATDGKDGVLRMICDGTVFVAVGDYEITPYLRMPGYIGDTATVRVTVS
jgi:hypothetical protein